MNWKKEVNEIIFCAIIHKSKKMFASFDRRMIIYDNGF